MPLTFASGVTREAYGKTLLELGRENKDIVVVGGDLNKSTFVHLFAKEFPDRFFDFGPAEQNMMSVAAGLASAGKIPFVSTFTVFGTSRPFDQIRVGIAQPHLNVKIVCTHASLITGEDGMSAQSVEDLALACALPGFTVIAPADSVETAAAVRAITAMKGPAYVRLYRSGTPIVHKDGYPFAIGKAETLRPGRDVTVVACGVMVSVALLAADALAQEGVQCRVVNVATLAPADEEAIAQAARETGAVVAAEDHYVRGGLSSIVAQALGRLCPVPLETVALHGYGESGKPNELMEKYGLTPAAVAAAAKKAIARKKKG
jgi:transketolase